MYGLSPPQRLPLGIPIKISIIEKNRKRAGDDGKRETEGNGLSSLFLLPIVPRALSFSFSPASPQYKEASAEERDVWQIASATVGVKMKKWLASTQLELREEY